MTELVRIGEERRGTAPQVRFDRAELCRLLNLYSRRVADGEWRDYAIDQQPGRAVFSVFRRSFERPLYTITKRGAFGFEVAQGPRRLAQTPTLEEALAIFDRPIRLVTH